ncbi:MAG: uridine kinase [Flavobacteriales bacterium]|jgi:uridine kinase|tara:strand:+ start:678 stop:1277 length:600 start_codon:yes stop_codon:yes gene_type:complete
MIIVGICGGTGSGKSTVAEKIEKYFKELGVVNMTTDSYYKNHSDLDFTNRSRINFDHPDSIDFDLLYFNLNNIKKNIKISEPIYSYKIHNRIEKTNLIIPKKIIIIEGLHILCNEKINKLLDLKIFLDVDNKTRLERRVNRDVKERGRSVDEINKRYKEMCEPMYDEFILPSKNHADIVLSSDKNSIKKIIDLISKKIK